ncbi:hypothetical protein K1719_024311 [Acacia pycnantha]|nr:hypothetical protein K1719_024311 [Acacia pycnantha]
MKPLRRRKLMMKEMITGNFQSSGAQFSSSFLKQKKLRIADQWTVGPAQRGGFYSYVKDNDMVTLYEALVADSILPLDQSVLGSMRAKIDEELKKLDEK